mmetsp:Transcript_13146/g.52661  ORF Transcript_13146/g.52661 Transcript_13146/m.52661 type:complete len:392 (-) Transcript_13146:37-1212(-)
MIHSHWKQDSENGRTTTREEGRPRRRRAIRTRRGRPRHLDPRRSLHPPLPVISLGGPQVRRAAEGVDLGLGGDVARRDAAIHEHRGPGDVGRLVRRQKERGVGHLGRFAEPSHRHVHEPALSLVFRIEKVLEERRVEGARAERVDANIFSRVDDRELARDRQHRTLGRGVRELRRRRAQEPDERRRVDDRSAPGAPQRRDAVLAAVPDALDVDVERAVPRGVLGVHGVVIRPEHDPRIVEHHVERPEGGFGRVDGRRDGRGVGDVDADSDCLAALFGDGGRRAFGGLGIDVGADDRGTFACELERSFAPDAPTTAGDEADLAGEAACRPAHLLGDVQGARAARPVHAAPRPRAQRCEAHQAHRRQVEAVPAARRCGGGGHVVANHPRAGPS